MKRISTISSTLFIVFLFFSSLSLLFAKEISGTPRIEKPFTHIEDQKKSSFKKDTLRIATWNIEWFPAGQRKSKKQNVQWQVAATANIIKNLEPDLLFTQETRNLNALKLLNKNLGPKKFHYLASSWYYNENLERKLNKKIQQQTGVLSKIPWEKIWEVDFVTLPRSQDKPARGWIAATFTLKSLTFTVYNGHLKSNFGAENETDRKNNFAKRARAIELLQKDLDRQGLDPYRDKIIILGDFNSDYFNKKFSDDLTFKKLSDLGFSHTFITSKKEDRVTLPAREDDIYPDGTFDYIWISSGWGNFTPQAKVVQKGASKKLNVYGGDKPGLASDHYPVYIDIPIEN